MRIARSPSANEGMTALHVAAQSGRADLVRYLLERGANPAIADSNGRTPLDLVSAGAGAGTPMAGRGGGRGGGDARAGAANAAAIRVLLETAASRK
jgi:hypothetical protein